MNLLADEQAHKVYQSTAYKVSLKGLLKPFKGKGELGTFLSELTAARNELLIIQRIIIKNAQSYPVKYLPLLLKEGKARSGASFVRWRNQANDKSGLPALRELLSENTIPEKAKQALCTIEHERIIFNMQMSCITTMIRQARECIEKINRLEDIRHESRLKSNQSVAVRNTLG